jgi:osmotically-inducible protein OsmY
MAGSTPKSYDEITRKTVPDPEGSWRPTEGQETSAKTAGYQALDAGEQDLHDRVRAALLALGIDASRIAIEVLRDHVTLRGSVTQGTKLDDLERAVHAVSGVGDLNNSLVFA